MVETEPLYYQYPTKYRFHAMVKRLLTREELEQIPEFHTIHLPSTALVTPKTPLYGILLDRTLFYPEGGGQPGDRGVLEAPDLTAELFYTFKTSEQDIIHLVDRPIPLYTQLEGQVDRAFRIDFQQQHSAQHLISAVLYKALNINTVSVHFGEHSSTVEATSEPLSEFQMTLLQEEVNHLIHSALPLVSKTVDKQSFDLSKLRRKPAKDYEVLRILEVGDYDVAPCGGCHATNTAEVAPIVLLGQEKTTKGFKVEYLAGKRALDAFTNQNRILQMLSQKLSTPILELPQALPTYFDTENEKIHSLQQANQLLQSKLLSSFAQSDDPILDLRSELNPNIAIISNYLAKEISNLGKTSLIVFNSEKGVRFILLDFTNKNLLDCMKQEPSIKKITGGGKHPRFEGTIDNESVDYMFRIIRSAK